MVDESYQFQIDDPVLYLPERVITRVVGYVWRTEPSGAEKIVLYQLDCGIATLKKFIEPI